MKSYVAVCLSVTATVFGLGRAELFVAEDRSTIGAALEQGKCEPLEIPFTKIRNLYFDPATLTFLLNGGDLAAVVLPGGRRVHAVQSRVTQRIADVDTWSGTTLVLLESSDTNSYLKHMFHFLEHIVGCFALCPDPDCVEHILLISDGRYDVASTWQGINKTNLYIAQALFPNAQMVPLSHQARALQPIIHLEEAIVSDRRLTVKSPECGHLNKMLGQARPVIPKERMRELSARVRAWAKADSSEHAGLRVTYVKRKPPRTLKSSVEKELLSRLSAIPGVQVTIASLEKLSFEQQIQLMAQTDVLLGVHGNGLSHILFLPDHASVIEIVPPKSVVLDYRLFANIAGIPYYGMLSSTGAWQSDTEAYATGALGNPVKGIKHLNIDAIAEVIQTLAQEKR